MATKNKFEATSESDTPVFGLHCRTSCSRTAPLRTISIDEVDPMARLDEATQTNPFPNTGDSIFASCRTRLILVHSSESRFFRTLLRPSKQKGKDKRGTPG
ncbi:hypothetical protein HYQ44_014946 [Verticillium longisporum]|nr:hypothetical protein HYQ44_014946 [Verticillium longisporum]